MSKSVKIKLNAYELMTFLGTTEPRLSKRVKGALDEELARSDYKALEPQEAFQKAARHLAVNRPEAFDPANRDDMAMKKLAPVIFTSSGKRVPPEKAMRQIELDNVTVAAQDLGSKFHFTVRASDPASGSFSARFSAPAKDPKREPGE